MKVTGDVLAQYRGCEPGLNDCYSECLEAAESTIERAAEGDEDAQEQIRLASAWGDTQKWTSDPE